MEKDHLAQKTDHGNGACCYGKMAAIATDFSQHFPVFVLLSSCETKMTFSPCFSRLNSTLEYILAIKDNCC